MNNAQAALQQAFGKAVRAFNAGQLKEAEKQCRLVLSAKPGLFEPRYLLALIQSALGQDKQAIENFDRAIALKPAMPELLSGKAAALQRLGRLTEAVEIYDRALKLNPRSAEILFNRGTALEAMGQSEAALDSYDRAIAEKPDFVEAINNRGIRLQELGRLDEALASYDRALTLAPFHVAVLGNRGRLLRLLRRPVDAVADYDRALAADPKHLDLWNGRGIALQDLGRNEEALQSFDRALAIRPTDGSVRLNRARSLLTLGRAAAALDALDRDAGDIAAMADYLVLRGNALYELDRFEAAIESYDKALSLGSPTASMFSDRANALRQIGRFDEALTDYDRAIALDPASDLAIYGRGTLLLFLGRYDQGWPDFEKRRTLDGWPHRGLAPPEWDGSDIAGKTLFVYAEQGLGDTIQFCRFLQSFVARGAKVVAQVPQVLRALLASLEGVTVIAHTDPVPPHDFNVPMMSLPFALQAGGQLQPGGVPYLKADPARVAAWRQRLPAGPFRVGISWQGNPRAKVDRVRSAPLRAFAPLAAIPGVSLVSLQKNDGLEQLLNLPEGMVVETLPDDFGTGPDSFMDTAAVLMNLDLVVSIDSAVSHLSGALGRPLIVALKQIPEWRWMPEGDDTPWYPTARLFRQKRAGEWDEMFERIADEIRSRLNRA